MEDIQFISTARLIWRKARGCYLEFGLWEVFRRFVRESLRAMAKPERFIDISSVVDEFGIGAAPKSMDAVHHLKELGFRHLIDLRAERARSDLLANTKDISVHWVPTYDDWKPKPAEFYARLQAVIRQILSSRDGTKFLLCCAAGEHRAPLAGVFALVIMGYSLEDAIEMIKIARPVAELLPSYQSSLAAFASVTPADKNKRPGNSTTIRNHTGMVK